MPPQLYRIINQPWPVLNTHLDHVNFTWPIQAGTTPLNTTQRGSQTVSVIQNAFSVNIYATVTNQHGGQKVTSGHINQLTDYGDIHPNPGPIKDPCALCNKGVLVGIQCSLCDKWYHRICLNISKEELQALGTTDIDWYCEPCNKVNVLPAFSDSFFNEEENIPVPNNNTSTFNNSTDITSLAKGLPSGLKFAAWNIQSLKSKLDQVRLTLIKYNTEAAIVGFGETWLTSETADDDINIEGYRLAARRDRPHNR